MQAAPWKLLGFEEAQMGISEDFQNHGNRNAKRLLLHFENVAVDSKIVLHLSEERVELFRNSAHSVPLCPWLNRATADSMDFNHLRAVK